MTNSLKFVCFTLLGLSGFNVTGLQAQLMKRVQAGNILVTNRDVFSEYDLEGNVIQTIKVPQKEDVRGLGLVGIDCDEMGVVYGLVRSVIDATAESRHEVVVVSPDDNAVNWIPLPTEGSASYGYLGDVEITDDGKILVLVKASEAYLVDPESGATTRIPSGKAVYLAPDKRYYVAEEHGEDRHTTSVYQDLLDNQKDVYETHYASTIAVDSEGNIRLGSYGQIFKFDSGGNQQGELEVTKNWSGGAMGDMEFLPDDSLIAGSRDGTVYHIGKELNASSVRTLVKPESNASDSWVCYVVEQKSAIEQTIEAVPQTEPKRVANEKPDAGDNTEPVNVENQEAEVDKANPIPANRESTEKETDDSSAIFYFLIVVGVLAFAIPLIFWLTRRKP